MSADFPEHLAAVSVTSAGTIRETAACINRNLRGIALVLDDERRLIGTVTDGDIRRAILHGLNLDEEIGHVLELKVAQGIHAPITAATSATTEELVALMREKSVRHIPVLDGTGRVVDLAALSDFVESVPLRAVVMAGGFGRRLHPLTEETPKPMLTVGDKPMIEHVFDRLRDSGIHHVKVATHFRGEAIREHFGDGAKLGLDIEYVDEEKPLGTAGALGLIEGAEGPMLVMNADVMSEIDFRAMHDFHREHDAKLTVGVREYEITVPFGVVNCSSEKVLGIQEKPQAKFLVNAGIYLVEADVLRHIPPQTRMDMPDVINAMIAEGERVVAYPIVEYWLDVGRHDDYRQAQSDYKDQVRS